jgi:4-hydroxymandelate oxidase
VLTGDTPVVGRKRRDSLVSAQDRAVNLGALDDPGAAVYAADLSFADVGWLSEISGGLPVVVKGVLRGDDARACQAHGASAVIVSNHGGRQLDGAIPAAVALPGVAAALAGPLPAGPLPAGPLPAARCEVYADGGVRTGEDVLMALALGAGAVFVGRPVLWALAGGGADGVRSFLAGLTGDLAHAMALAGAPSVAEIAEVAAATAAAGRPLWHPAASGLTLEL